MDNDHDIACPSCGEQFTIDAQAILPAQTDLTVSLTITPGQLCMAKTVAGVIENFAALQTAVGEQLGVETDVFIAGLSYENDRIDMTFRIANAAKDVVAEQRDLFNADAPETTQVQP